MLCDYCAERGVNHQRCGKLIVAGEMPLKWMSCAPSRRTRHG